jgi:hypothetical protein
MLRNFIQGIITTLLASAAVLLCAFSVAYCSFVESDITTLAGILSVSLAYAAGHSATASLEPISSSLPKSLLRVIVIATLLVAAFKLNFFSRNYFAVIEIELSLVVAALSLVFAFAAGFCRGTPWESQSSQQAA